MLVFLAFLVVSGVLVSATESETIVIDSSGSFGERNTQLLSSDNTIKRFAITLSPILYSFSAIIKSIDFWRSIRSARIHDIEASEESTIRDFEVNSKELSLLCQTIAPFKGRENAPKSNAVFIAQHSSSILFIKKTCWPIANLSWQRSFALYQSWETYQCYSARLYVLVQQFAICNISYRRYSSEAIKTDLRINLDEQNEQMKMNHSKEQMLHSPINLKRYENHLVNMSFFQVAPANGIHGKKDFNLFTKYLSKTCAGNCFMLCRKFRIKLQEHRLPAVTLAIIINVPVPFFDAFLKNIERLNYPKKQMHLFIYNGAKFHDAAVRFFYKCWQNKYKSSNMISSTHQWNEQEGRQRAIEEAVQTRSDYVFVIAACVHVDDADTLRDLLAYDREFLAPILKAAKANFSNFHLHTNDYNEIVNRDIIGLWNAWDVSSIYLIKNTAFKYINYDHEHHNADMIMSLSLRNANINLHVTNERDYGHLINTDNFNVTLTRPDLYNLLQNPFDWIRKYISTNYLEQLQAGYTASQPCQDVYLFHLVTDVFADDLLAVMESYCRRKYDSDLENFDARAIHMSQVDLETVWLRFLQYFVQPLQRKIFLTKRFGVPDTAAHFIVRYKTAEEHFVAPKHNSRVYSADIALNHIGVEYNGGGRYFKRYNCSVINIEKGWMIMHPGRITHVYTDLPIVKGISYTAVSLIYP